MDDYKLKIIFMGNGTYGVFQPDGINPMEFVDKTSPYCSTMKEAIKVCVDHEYSFEMV